MLKKHFHKLLNSHLLEYLPDLIFTHKPLMPENLPIFLIEEYLGGDEADSICRGQPAFLVNFDDLYNDPISVFL